MIGDLVPHLPNTKWAGSSHSHAAGDWFSPDAYDWDQLLNELDILQDLALLAYTNSAVSAIIQTTNVETYFDKIHTIKANTLKPGDLIKVRLRIKAPSTHSTDTLTIKLYIGSVVLATLGPTNVANNDEGYIDAEIFIPAANKGHYFVRKSTLAAPAAWTISEVGAAEGTLTSTADLIIRASATWSVSDSTNQVELTQLNVELKRGINN